MKVDSPILLVKTHAFGDALLCTPVIRKLVTERKAEYWILTGDSAAAVWERFPGIGRIFVAPMPPSSGIDGYMKLLRWTIRNRKILRSVSESIVFQSAPAVRRWVRYLTCSNVTSAGDRRLGGWETVIPMNSDEYAGISYANIAGVRPDDWRAVFGVTDSEKDWAARMGLSGPLFAIAPGGGRNPRDNVLEKRWLPGRYAVIADRLSASGFNVVLIGGSGDTGIAEETAVHCGAEILDLTGRTTWGQTAALLDRCYGFLGADSGTAHLAAAMGIPSVVLFGPSSPDTLFAPGLITPVRGSTDCSPCYSNSLFPGCIHERAICMEAVETDDVWFVLQKVLNENYSS